MNSLYNVIIRPIISERSYDLMEQGKYTFEVAKDAPKQEIRQAVEKLFNVHVVKVNTMNVRGKEKRVRYQSGMTRSWKKAVVTLAGAPKRGRALMPCMMDTRGTVVIRRRSPFPERSAIGRRRESFNGSQAPQAHERW